MDPEPRIPEGSDSHPDNGNVRSSESPGGCPKCGSHFLPCRRRGCRPSLYASDVRTLALANLSRVEGVRLVVQTPPGSDVLSWDRSRCVHPARVPCSGRRGCRVDEEARHRWEGQFDSAYRRVRQRVTMRLRRKGLASPLVSFFDENQTRGVLHRNLVLKEGPAAIAFQREWAREAKKEKALGFVDRRPVVMSGLRAGVYLASYVTGAKGEASLEARLLGASPRVRIYYLTPRLTSSSRVTMRTLRNGRRLWAVREGHLAMPEATCSHGSRRGCSVHGFGVTDGIVVCMSTGEIYGPIWGPDRWEAA